MRNFIFIIINKLKNKYNYALNIFSNITFYFRFYLYK